MSGACNDTACTADTVDPIEFDAQLPRVIARVNFQIARAHGMSFVDIDASLWGLSVVLVVGAVAVALLRFAEHHARRATVDKTRRILQQAAKRVGD